RLRPRSPPPDSDARVLLATHRISAPCRIAGGWERCLPEQLASRFIERAEFLVLCGGDEHQAAGGNYRSAVLLRAGVANASRCQFRVLAERDAPAVVAVIEVDCAECAPRWFGRRISGGVPPALVSDKLVG